ncbi:MAG: hypothetical protein HY302_08865, partial [Opitutae bacterium]|nr:hypothetical protein [Opitutae bacterium]
GEVNDPLPIYHAIGMFTGESLFPGFGRDVVAVTVASGAGLLAVVASGHPRNIVAINSSPDASTDATFTLPGVAGAAVAVWQKNPAHRDVVRLAATRVADGKFSYRLEPYTVTTFVLTPEAGQN